MNMRGSILIRIARASAWSRRLPLTLTVLAVALTTAVLVSTERLRKDLRSGFSQALAGTDLIVAARSHPIQVLLSTVFHFGSPSQNVSLKALEAVAAMPQVAWVVPIALGDSLRGMPVVATRSDYFKRVRTGDSRPLAFAQGRPFMDQAPGSIAFEAVLGTTVAERLNLRLGDPVTLAHGSGPIPTAQHDQYSIRVVGVLQPTGTPIDRSVLVSLEVFHALHAGWVGGVPPRYGLGGRTPAGGAEAGVAAGGNSSAAFASSTSGGHAGAEAVPLPSTVTAALVGLHSRSAVFSVQRQLERPQAEPLTAVLPGVTLDQLWQMVGRGEALLHLTGLLVGFTAIAGLAATLLAGLEARRRELAVLRALGAAPRTLFSLILIEAVIIALAGIALGLAVSAATLALIEPELRAHYGIALSGGWFNLELIAPMAMILAASVAASLVPAWRAVRLTLADGLTPPH